MGKSRQKNRPFSKKGLAFFILMMGILTVLISSQVNTKKTPQEQAPERTREVTSGGRNNFSDLVLGLQRDAQQKHVPVSPPAQAPAAPPAKTVRAQPVRKAKPAAPRYHSDKELAQAASELKNLKTQALMARPETSGFGGQQRSGNAGGDYAATANMGMQPANAQGGTVPGAPGMAPQQQMTASQQKIDFLLNPQEAQSMTKHGYSGNIPIPQQFRWELKAGTMIPTILMNGVDSSIPGMVRAQVAENVWDSTGGSHVLIPKGTMAIGVYNTDVKFGDRRIMFVWNRLIFPNGTTLDISGTAGTDQSGYSGSSGRVNEHWDQMFLSALISSLFIAGAESLMDDDPSYNSNNDKKSTRDIMAEALAANILDINSRIMGRALNIAPTIRIRPGKRMGMFVNQDIVFPAPYPMKY